MGGVAPFRGGGIQQARKPGARRVGVLRCYVQSGAPEGVGGRATDGVRPISIWGPEYYGKKHWSLVPLKSWGQDSGVKKMKGGDFQREGRARIEHRGRAKEGRGTHTDLWERRKARDGQSMGDSAEWGEPRRGEMRES
jgi:hypothetical protein